MVGKNETKILSERLIHQAVGGGGLEYPRFDQR